MKLYEIANEYKQIFDEIELESETGELNEEAVLKLSDLQTKMDDKVVAVACFIKNIDAERNAIAEAKKAMAIREARLNRKIEFLEDYLRFNMERCKITEISSSPYFTIKLKKNPYSVDIEDESIIPKDYWKEKVTVSLDKMKIKEEMQQGVIIPGVRLVQNSRVEIK